VEIKDIKQGLRDLAACAEVLDQNCKTLILSDKDVSAQTVLSCLEGQIWRLSQIGFGLRAFLSKEGNCEGEERTF
jgi:hypothetical protein